MQSKTLTILSYGSAALVIILMVAATVVEKFHGTETALSAIYHNPLFFALWAVLAASGMALLLRRGGARRPATLALHVALVLILGGALITHLSGQSGSIHLREGEATATVELEDGTSLELPFSLELKEFRIEYDPGTRRVADYVSELRCAGVDETISMNHILKHDGYRFYQADYDEDGHGSILAVSHDPWGVGVTYAGYILLLLAMIGYFFEPDSHYRQTLRSLRRERKPGPRRHVGTIVLAVLGVGLLVAWFLDAFPKGPLMPVLRSPMLFIHVVPMMVCYSVFSLLALLGIVGLCVRPKTSERLRAIGYAVLYPAVFLLAFGTFFGAVWANISWGNYWAWDPKETWALNTLLIYAFALHGGSLRAADHPRRFHLFCILAFLAVLVTYFGVNLFLGGVHSYA
jgi:ABC-type transport system involved in cytochrome c biogenesis permease subunit